MIDASSVSAALTSLKTATEIANLLRSGDLSLEKAEMKLRLADLISSLADARMQLTDLQEGIKQQGVRLAELEDAFQVKDELVPDGDAYYRHEASGATSGPYCVRCWEVDHRQYRLVRTVGLNAICQACGSQYDRRQVKGLYP